jgi:hypothetical protein
MPAEQVRHYLQRATDFFEGMRLMHGEEDYSNSSALLAIHCAISYSDALRVGLGDGRVSADDHQNASVALERLLVAKRLQNQTGLKYLQYLLSRKSLVAYGSERLNSNEIEALINKANRFQRWAHQVARQFKIEGWTHEDR